MIRIMKRLAEKEASNPKRSLFSLLALAAIALGGIVCIPYSILDIVAHSYWIVDDFEKLSPRQIVQQEISTSSKTGRSMVFMKDDSGMMFELGVFTPGFNKLKVAVEKGEDITIWFHKYIFKPKLIAQYIQVKNPTVYQVSANDGVIISFSDIIDKKQQEGLYLILMLAFMELGLILFSPIMVWAITLRLKESNQMP